MNAKKLILLAVVLVIAGIIGTKFEKNSIDESRTFLGDGVSTIIIGASNAHIHISPSESNEILLELRGDIPHQMTPYFSAQIEDGVLQVDFNLDKGHRMGTDFSAIYQPIELTLHLPAHTFERLQVENSHGAIEIFSIQAAYLDVNASNAHIDLADLSANITATNEKGNITFRNGQLSQNVSLNTSDGSIVLALENPLMDAHLNLSTDGQAEAPRIFGTGEFVVDLDVVRGKIVVDE